VWLRDCMEGVVNVLCVHVRGGRCGRCSVYGCVVVWKVYVNVLCPALTESIVSAPSSLFKCLVRLCCSVLLCLCSNRCGTFVFNCAW